MKLTCYAIDDFAPPLRPAPATRPWMDGVIDNHAYRCLPLVVANAYGWEVPWPFAFTAEWDGDPHPRGLVLRDDDGREPPPHRMASHFGYGIVTFHLSYLFRTEPGYDLVAGGPANAAKDGIAPLTGVIEADWLPFPFTMNWQMTRPGRVRFERDEAVCSVFPVLRALIRETEPEIVALDDHPDVKAELRAWSQRRNDLMRELQASPRALKDAWLRDYFVGRMPDGTAVPGHQARLRVAAPADRRTKPGGSE